MEEFENVPYDLEMVNLGSTFSKYGFDYQYFGKRGYNFAVAPQPLKIDHETLEKYKDHIKKGAVVVVVVCPFGFCVYDYSEFPKPSEPTLTDKVVLATKKVVKKVIRYDRIKEKRLEKLPIEERARRMGESRANGWKNEFSLPDTTTAHASEKLKRTFARTRKELEGILLLCKEMEFKPVVINMPAASAEYKLFSDSFIKEFYEDNLNAANVTGTPTIDYFRDARFDDPLLYENYADCFNDKGRKMFAKILIDDLKKIGIWD